MTSLIQYIIDGLLSSHFIHFKTVLLASTIIIASIKLAKYAPFAAKHCVLN
jgi:hypothetical protein